VENNSTWLPSPPSPTTSVRSGFGIPASIAFAAGALGVALLAIIAFFLYVGSTGKLDLHAGKIPIMYELIAELAIYVPVGAYLLLFLPLLAGRSLGELGLRAPGWREIGIGVAGFFVMLIAVDGSGAVMSALTHRHDTEAAIALLKQIKTPEEKYLFLSIAIVFAPLLEELGFRVFLFNSFARHAPVWIAALVSGLIFGAVHSTSPAQLLTVSIPLAAGGAVLAGVYAISRSYWSSVITHALFNALPLTLIFVFHVKA
jgi:membrane protease YdiL (CAAX protease family)